MRKLLCLGLLSLVVGCGTSTEPVVNDVPAERPPQPIIGDSGGDESGGGGAAGAELE